MRIEELIFRPRWFQRLGQWLLADVFYREKDAAQFAVEIKRVYGLLTEAEKQQPRRITVHRKRTIAESLMIRPAYVDASIVFLQHLRDNFSVTFEDMLAVSVDMFTSDVVRVLHSSRMTAESLNHEFIDSAHWLVSLQCFGSQTLHEAFNDLGLDYDVLRKAHLALEGHMSELPLRADRIYLSKDGTATFEHLKRVFESRNSKLDETAFALGLLQEGKSKAAELLKICGINLSAFVDRLSKTNRFPGRHRPRRD